MLGRLPARYRHNLLFAGLLTSSGAVTWVALMTSLPSV